MNFKILAIESSVKSKLNRDFSVLNQHRYRREPVLEFEGECNEEEEQRDVPTLFQDKQKNQDIFCKITRKDMAMFFQSLHSTAQSTTII